MTQSEEFSQVLLGGTGDATLRVNYLWYRSSGIGGFSRAGLTDPDPIILFNGQPVAYVKSDVTQYLVDGSDANLWRYTVDMPVVFGVRFTRGWTQSTSITLHTGEYAGTHFMTPPLNPPAPNLGPYMQVLQGGNTVAFTALDVREPSTWMLIGFGAMLLPMLRRAQR